MNSSPNFYPYEKCVYCGLENADDAVMCATCHTEFVPTPGGLPPALRNEYMISPEEWRFWNRMTFRQFAVVMVRLGALWCFFTAALEASSLVQYMLVIPFLNSTPRYPGGLYPMIQFFIPALRSGLCVAAGFILYFRGEGVLSWLVRSAVQRQPPEISPRSSTSAPRPGQTVGGNP